MGGQHVQYRPEGRRRADQLLLRAAGEHRRHQQVLHRHRRGGGLGDPARQTGRLPRGAQIKQDTGNDLPVIEANLLTNSMYNQDAWEQFRSGEDYLANPEDYLQYYDCCWLLSDASLYDQLQAAGWYDGQCCWEQDGDGGWKNCDYCTNCSPEN